jgi:hypothetical protein
VNDRYGPQVAPTSVGFADLIGGVSQGLETGLSLGAKRKKTSKPVPSFARSAVSKAPKAADYADYVSGSTNPFLSSGLAGF